MPTEIELEKLIINKNLTKERFEQAIADGSIGENDLSFVDEPIDTVMSDTSENPVQNRVIKAYVDNNIGNKVNRDEADYVVETYADDNGNWYRYYKSGWVEQGGRASTSNSKQTITLLKPFSDENYCLVSGNNNGASYAQVCACYIISSTQIEIRSAGTSNWIWYACGQGV